MYAPQTVVVGVGLAVVLINGEDRTFRQVSRSGNSASAEVGEISGVSQSPKLPPRLLFNPSKPAG